MSTIATGRHSAQAVRICRASSNPMAGNDAAFRRRRWAASANTSAASASRSISPGVGGWEAWEEVKLIICHSSTEAQVGQAAEAGCRTRRCSLTIAAQDAAAKGPHHAAVAPAPSVHHSAGNGVRIDDCESLRSLGQSADSENRLVASGPGCDACRLSAGQGSSRCTVQYILMRCRILLPT